MNQQLKTRRKGLNGIRRAPRFILRKVFDDLHRQIGRRHEEDALRSLQPENGRPLPDWLHRAVPASGTEDHHGIDIVVHTDVGKLYLQIKSSQYGVRKFLAKHTKGNIIPYIVRTDDLTILRERLLTRLTKERERIIAIRSGR